MTDHLTPRPDFRRAQPRGRRGTSWLAIAGYGGLALGCLLVAVVTFLIVAAPVDLVRDRLAQEVKSRTGRDLVLAGPTSLVLFPRVGLAFSDVTLSAPPGMGGAPTAVVQNLEAEVGLGSLLSRQIGIKSLTLTRPVIELRVDGQGRRSWDFAWANPETVKLAQRPQAAPVSSDARRAAGARLLAVLGQLAQVNARVVDGTVRFTDDRSGARHEAKALDLNFVLAEAAGPLDAKGSLSWLGERVAFEANVSSVRALLEDQRARTTFRLAGRPFEASYDGALSIADGPVLEGNLGLKAGSAQALGAWLGKPVANGADPGGLTITSGVRSADGQVALRNLTGSLGDTSLAGALTIETKGDRPRVSGNLKLSQLDMGRLLIRAAPASATPSGPGPSPQAGPAERAPAKGPQVRGFTKRAGGGPDWSDDVIDLTALGLADADITLAADRLVYKDVKTGPTRASLQLKDKVAKLTLEDMQLYGGRGRGVVTLDGTSQAPATAVNLALERVSTLPLLKDAMGFEWLDGQSTITIALTGRGASERQIVEGLNGKAELTTANGAISGIDIGKVLGGIEQGRLGSLGASPGDRTPFSEFAGTFTVVNGVATNQNLRLVSARMQVTGAGTINLAQRNLDYTVNPKIVGGISTPGAVINVKNLEIPVRIEGPWEKPNFSIKGQEQIIDAIKSIKPKDVEDAIKGLLGGSDGDRTKPRELLDKLFKKQ